MRDNIIILIKVFQVFTFCEERNNVALQGPICYSRMPV
jgi:hypothetical protein